MPSVTPSGAVSLPLKYLRDTLAGSSTFRTLVGEETAAAAKRHIRYFGLNLPAAWSAETAYALGDWVYATATGAYLYECTTAGTSGATAPDWPAADGDTVTDGAAVWTARAVPEGAADDPAAQANAHARLVRPFAMVGVGEEASAQMVAAGSANEFRYRGALSLFLEAATPSAYTATRDDAGLWFANRLGAILGEMAALAGTPSYLNIVGFQVDSLVRSPEEAREVEGDYFQAEVTVRWQGGA